MSQSENMPPAKDQDLRHFNTFLTRLEGGALEEELSELLRKAVSEISDACLDRGGKHTATITLKVALTMDAKDKVIEVAADVTDKMPKAPRGRGGLFFAGRDGYLSRENPRQQDMFDDLQRRRDERTMAQAGVVHSE